MAGGQLFRKITVRSGEPGEEYSLFLMLGGIEALKELFPDGEATREKFALFSTGGAHGDYQLIEDCEEGLTEVLTVLIVQPKLCCLKFGTVTVTPVDVPYLKKLRASSWQAVQRIG
jgi:hypothetical protein